MSMSGKLTKASLCSVEYFERDFGVVSSSGRSYIVSFYPLASCTCPYGVIHEGRAILCSHVLAVMSHLGAMLSGDCSQGWGDVYKCPQCYNLYAVAYVEKGRRFRCHSHLLIKPTHKTLRAFPQGVRLPDRPRRAAYQAPGMIPPKKAL